MSMRKTSGSHSGTWSMVSIACLLANMQQTLEQYSCSWSREPTHWMKATFLGCAPSDGRLTSPIVGPEALSMRSYSSAESTLGYRL